MVLSGQQQSVFARIGLKVGLNDLANSRSPYSEIYIFADDAKLFRHILCDNDKQYCYYNRESMNYESGHKSDFISLICPRAMLFPLVQVLTRTCRIENFLVTVL